MSSVRIPSPDEIKNKMTDAGGWTRDTLAEWGVPWPPPKGWRRELERLYGGTQESHRQSDCPNRRLDPS